MAGLELARFGRRSIQPWFGAGWRLRALSRQYVGAPGRHAWRARWLQSDGRLLACCVQSLGERRSVTGFAVGEIWRWSMQLWSSACGLLKALSRQHVGAPMGVF